MFDLSGSLPTIAVFPVLVGPLQALLALLPVILAGTASLIFAAFRPAGFVRLMRFVWRQKLFLGCVAGIVWAWQSGIFASLLPNRRTAPGPIDVATLTSWDSARGGRQRLGRGPGNVDPTKRSLAWKNQRDKTVLSSPALTGERVLFATATDIGPFSPEGRGAIVCLDAHSGLEVWRYAPDNYRATFSSPVVSAECVVCGEGLHQVSDARVSCLDIQTGRLRWERRTNSHVESTPAISQGRVFFGAGDDGFYCVNLQPDAAGQPSVLWHLVGDQFPDCESSPVVGDGVVYFGLGEEGCAVCAVDVQTGQLVWKVATPFPAFAPPTLDQGKLFIATGNGNFVQSAADLLEMKLQILRDEGATDTQLAEARERLKPVGEVWCIDLATRQVDWKFTTADAILGAIASADSGLYFGSRDGSFYRISKTGELLQRYDLHEPLISSPAVGQEHVYCTTASGRLFCLNLQTLKPVWDDSLGSGDTFVSSPTIGHGHVYVGTANEGLCCLGEPGHPEPTIWTHGEQGGAADEVRVPEPAEVLWQFPAKNDGPFEVTAPLMPLDGALYAAGLRNGNSEVVKLDCNRADRSVSQVWSHPFDGRIEVALVGCGNRIGIVEDLPDSTSLRLHIVSTDDGQPAWSCLLQGPNPMRRKSPAERPAAGISVDTKRLYAWIGAATLGCFDLQTGVALWDRPFVPNAAQDSIRSENVLKDLHGCGVATSTGEIVLALAASEVSQGSEPVLVALDGPSGKVLWHARISDRTKGSPIVDGLEVLIPRTDDAAVFSLLDGTFLRNQQSFVRSTIPWQLSAEFGGLVGPRVSQNGCTFFATDRGRILCLGARFR